MGCTVTASAGARLPGRAVTSRGAICFYYDTQENCGYASVPRHGGQPRAPFGPLK